MTHNRRGSFKANVILGLLAMAIAVACSELLLRLLLPVSQNYFVLIPNTHAVFDVAPGVMPGVAGTARYEVNSHGIRGPDFDAGEAQYRILAMGGSTTECLYLSESESWPQLLQEALGSTAEGWVTWVGNVGRSGMNARDHVVHVKYLVPQYPKIDALLVLVGVNDLTLALQQGQTYVTPPPILDEQAEQEQIRRAFLMAPGRLLSPTTDYWLDPNAPWYKGTAIWQLLKRARLRLTVRLTGGGLYQDTEGRVYSQWRNNRKNASEIIDSLPNLQPALDEYRRNLDAIVTLANEYDTRLILMTQPTLWRDDLPDKDRDLLWLGGIGDFMTRAGRPYYSVGALAQAMLRFNETLLGVCEDRNVECVDLAARIPKDASMMYDDAHFTELGSRTVAQVIAEFLQQSPPY
jgi:hypothetical protein